MWTNQQQQYDMPFFTLIHLSFCPKIQELLDLPANVGLS